MKLLGIASFFLAVLCVCTVGEDGVSTSTVSSTIAASTTKSVPAALSTTVSQATTVQTSVLPEVVKTTVSQFTRSNPTTSSPSATHHTTQATTTRPPVRAATTSADKGVSTTTNTTQASGTQTAHKESLDVSSTKGWSSSSTTPLQKTTSASGTSGPGVTSPTESTNLTSASSGSSSENKKVPGSEIHYSSVILPVVITLIVITLSVFSLVALYRMCQKKTPERQENGTEQAQSDKEGVKLLSVKTTSSETGSTWKPLGAGEEAQSLGRKPETSSQKRIPSQQRDRSNSESNGRRGGNYSEMNPVAFHKVCDVSVTGFSLPSANLSDPTTPPPSGEVSQGSTTGEHSSQGKNKTRQLFTPQQ